MKVFVVLVALVLGTSTSVIGAQKAKSVDAEFICSLLSLRSVDDAVKKIANCVATSEIGKVNAIYVRYTVLQAIISKFKDKAVIDLQAYDVAEAICYARKLGNELSPILATLVRKGACPFMDSKDEHHESALFIALKSSMPHLSIVLFENAPIADQRRYFALHKAEIQSNLQGGFDEYVKKYNARILNKNKRRKPPHQQKTSLYKKHYSQAVEYFKNISPNVAFYGGLNRVKNFFDLKIVTGG